MRDTLLGWIENDKEEILRFLQMIVREPSPTPPGDTVAVMKHISALLDKHTIAYDVLSKDEIMPNLVASTPDVGGGKHLVLNGHIDVFPVESRSDWSCDPWGAEIRENKMYG